MPLHVVAERIVTLGDAVCKQKRYACHVCLHVVCGVVMYTCECIVWSCTCVNDDVMCRVHVHVHARAHAWILESCCHERCGHERADVCVQ